MRLSEFVDRPPALINKTADVDGIQVSVNADGAHVTAYALADGRRLGYVVFDRDGHVLVPYDLAVEERYRGQGIAAVMYDYVKSLGFTIRASDDQTDAGRYFWSKNRGEERVWENFADGKVKGRSRPGRVKKAGASCNGSVTSLRAKAKKYGGERGKMYHWCANMKSGRSKK